MSHTKSVTPADFDLEPQQPVKEEKRSTVVRAPSKQHEESTSDLSHNGTDGFFTEEKKSSQHRVLFRKIAYGIIFLRRLQRLAARNRSTRPRLTASATIHKIRLQEILVALHRVYLEPDGPIYNSLIQAINSPIELEDALNPSAIGYNQANQLICETLKSIIAKIVDFMPRDGILGTTTTSAIAALLQDGNPFPDNYFWQCEKQLLEFHKSKIINITKQRAVLLFIGMFIFRSLVTTLLLKPIKYRFLLGQLSQNQSMNCKVLASLFFYIGRRTAGFNSQILALPQEWESRVFNDTDIKGILQHSETKSILTKCELSLRIWTEEYITRIDGSFGKALRS